MRSVTNQPNPDKSTFPTHMQTLKGLVYLTPACIKHESIQKSKTLLNLEEHIPQCNTASHTHTHMYGIQGENAMTAVSY
jgi:hypothetical protein